MTTFPFVRLLNQTVTYQPFTGVNYRDDPTYGTTQTLAARYVELDREHYARDEDAHQVRSRVWVLSQPVLRSLVNGREIISTSAVVAVDGTVVGWEATLR